MEFSHKVEIVFFDTSDNPQTLADVQVIKATMRATDPELGQVWAQQDVGHKHPLRTYAIYLLKE